MQVVGGEDHIDGSTASSIATLAFREKSMFQMAVETVVEDAGEDLPGDVEQQDSFVIITELSVPFQFVEMDSCGVMQILRDVALVPPLLEYRCKFTHQLETATFVDFGRDHVDSSVFRWIVCLRL
ncbi:hypothetical protein SprV_0200814300 [Sparganum proliferum]